MKKILGVVLIVAIVGIYWVWVSQDEPSQEEVKTTEQTMNPELMAIDTRLTVNYPTTAEEVLEIHNELMTYQYGDTATSGDVAEVIRLIRLLYGKELLVLNTEEAQIETVEAERVSMVGKGYLKESQIVSTQAVEEKIVVAEVLHNMVGMESVHRTYYIIQEEEQWKIHSWQ